MWFAQSAHTGFARSPNVTPTLISSPDVPEDAEALDADDADDELEPAAGVEVADADFSDVDFAVDAALSPEPHPMRPQAIAPANVNATHFEMFFFIPSSLAFVIIQAWIILIIQRHPPLKKETNPR